MAEEWKILNYQGQQYDDFEISNLGRLRNVKTGTIYKQTISATGYYQVCVSLGHKDKRKVFRVHKAVAETFIYNPENKAMVNHIDGNKLNNNIDNLEWMTAKENTQHAWNNGLITALKGEINGNAKLTKEQVEWIREHYIPRSREFGSRALGKMFGVDHMNILRVVKNEAYTN